MSRRILFIIIVLFEMACKDAGNQKQDTDMSMSPVQPGTFAYDHQFLLSHDSSLIELNSGNASILVSPKYQAKVFTSTASGPGGKSFGWINYKAFTAPPDQHMNAFGGENRFWLGPEGGKYSLYFKPNDAMLFDNWKTPAPIDTETWPVVKKDMNAVVFEKEMQLMNYTGNTLSMKITRSIAIQDKKDIESSLGILLNDSVNFAGYSTQNELLNAGKEEWTKNTGMPCIWILDMFNPSDSTTVVIPYKTNGANDKVATTDYFGEIPLGRIRLDGKTLFFKADGKSRGKLGILPKNVLPVAGSYDAAGKVLTIALYTVDNNALYLYQGWNTANPEFSGDAMNAYNDGPLENGSQMGPFYEIESVSPAAALKPGESIMHMHNVYHFTGNIDELDKIAKKVLGVSLNEIRDAFNK